MYLHTTSTHVLRGRWYDLSLYMENILPKCVKLELRLQTCKRSQGFNLGMMLKGYFGAFARLCFPLFVLVFQLVF